MTIKPIEEGSCWRFSMCQSTTPSIPAVDNISFSARSGEVTGYLGLGSGKSTTMKMITGLIEMTSGRILFQGKPIDDDLIAYKRPWDMSQRSRISITIFQGRNT